MCAFKDVAFKNPAFVLSLFSHGLTLVIVSFVPILVLLSDVSFFIQFLLPEPLNFAVPVEIAIACRSATGMISCIGYHGGRRKAGVPEYIMCSIQQGSSPPVFVAVIYRPPDAELINSDLAVTLEQHSVGFAHQIVMGDLNANMLVTEQESTFVKHLACQLNLKLIEHGALWVKLDNFVLKS